MQWLILDVRLCLLIRKILVNFSFAAGVLRFYDIKNGTLVHRKDAVVKPMNYKVKNDDYGLGWA